MVPPWMGGGTHRCFNDPDRLAIGLCNDCGESFCGGCLHVYALKTESARAILYLCPNCLRKRHIEKVNATIYLGIFFLLYGIFSALLLLPLGVLIVLIGVGAIIYGWLKRTETPKELTINELRVEKEKRGAELVATGGIDTEEIYNKLLTQYVNHWGAQKGIAILKSEIMAYTIRGVSFQEAVKKVYQRQHKKTS